MIEELTLLDGRWYTDDPHAIWDEFRRSAPVSYDPVGQVRGQQVHEGDQVMLFSPSANRDEDVFDDPHRFDVRRNPNPHVAFGFGTHFCLGASLARLEVRVMFEELLPRMTDIELAAPEPLRRRTSNFVSGLETLPITFTPFAGGWSGPIAVRVLRLPAPVVGAHVGQRARRAPVQE